MKISSILCIAQLWAVVCLAADDEAGAVGFGAAGFANGAGVRIVTRAEPPRDRNQLGLANGYAVDKNALHRSLVDNSRSLYFGYDLFVEPLPGGKKCRVSISPLDSVKPDNAAIRTGGTAAAAGSGAESSSHVPANYRSVALPKYPEPQFVEPGDTIALDLLVSSDGKVKLTDYITIVLTDSKPSGSSARDVSVQGEARDIKDHPSLPGQTNVLKPGDSPPRLEFRSLLQAPVGAQTTWQAQKGKVVVLEFWATWCLPCVRAIPHLNEMADRFQNSQIQFIAISDEKPETVATFLKKRPIHAWIGLDADKSTFSRYGVNAIPCTVVIDQDGRIAAITNPEDLTEKPLRDLLSGKPIALPTQERQGSLSFKPGELAEPGNNASQPLFRLLIRPSESLNSGWGGAGGKFTFIGSSVVNLLCAAYDLDEFRIIPNCELPNERFDAVLNVPAAQTDAGRNWLRMAVEGTFGVVSRRETRQMDVMLLTMTNPNPEHLTVALSSTGSSSHSSTDKGELQAMNLPISALVGSLQGLFKRPIVDSTGLTNRYDWQLHWNANPAQDHPTAEILNAVRDQLGLELTPAKCPVEVVVVEKPR